MLSLDNALNEAELRAFDARVRDLAGGADFRYVAELKMDGLSMAAHYRQSRFTQAVTRGDGSVGEDVTENARTIRSVPLRVDTPWNDLETRGEVVMNRRAFERLNLDRDREGLSRFANPRKPPPPAPCGVIEPQITASRGWNITPISCSPPACRPWTANGPALEELVRLGFKVNSHRRLCHTVDRKSG